MNCDEKMVSIDFEVKGQVKGTHFKVYAKDFAHSKEVTGYIYSKGRRTITGRIEGYPDKIEEMKQWLAAIGSPRAVITEAVFCNEQEMSQREYRTFDIPDSIWNSFNCMCCYKGCLSASRTVSSGPTGLDLADFQMDTHQSEIVTYRLSTSSIMSANERPSTNQVSTRPSSQVLL